MKDEILSFSELQLGNILKCRKSNDAAEYRIMALDGLNMKIMLDGARKGTWYDLTDLRAIQLDHTWYEDFDFKKVVEKTVIPELTLWERSVGLNDWDQEFILSITDPKSEIYFIILYSTDTPESRCQILGTIKYVHELQNLWKQLSFYYLVNRN